MALQNLFGALGLDSTLQAILSKLGTPLNVSTAGMEKVLIGNAQDKFREDFFSLDSANWDIVSQGAGQTVSVDGTTTRYLKVSSGTTANEETILLSKNTFAAPFKIGFGFSASQRIANTNLYVELVGVDDNGVIETDTTFPSVNTKDATNCAGLWFNGTSATVAQSTLRANGCPELIGAAQTVGTSVATGTTPNFVAANSAEILMDTEEVVYSGRTVDGTATSNGFTRRTQSCPDPTKKYKIRIRVLNGATNPASNTDWRLHFFRAINVTRLTVDMARHFGRVDAATSIPVAVSNTPVLALFQSVDVAAVLIARFTETVTAILAAAGVQTGASRRAVGRANSSASYPFFSVNCFSPTDGSLRIQQSVDGTTWWDLTAPTAVTANVPVQITVRAVAEYHRAIFTNGSTAQTSGNPLRLLTSMMNA